MSDAVASGAKRTNGVGSKSGVFKGAVRAMKRKIRQKEIIL